LLPRPARRPPWLSPCRYPLTVSWLEVDSMADQKNKKAAGEPTKKKGQTAEAPPEAAKPAPEPRKPADPRLKYMKKMKGRFLPKGTLRDRHIAILARWESGEDHGGVTVEEVRSLFEDWRATRQPVARTN